MSTKKEVATANPFDTAMPAHVDMKKGRGSEDVSIEDVALPRLAIVQDLSPQHKKSKPEYIDGAEPGMIFNTVSAELYGQKAFVVPVYYEKEWVIWKDISKGGGFRGAYRTEDEANEAVKDYDDASDLEVVDTAQHYVLVVVPNAGKFDIMEAVISMSKSQMKVNRKWNAMIRMAGGDRFSRVYSLSVVEDSNSAGQEYYNWKVKSEGYCPKEVFEAAERMYDAVKSGEKKVSREEAAYAADDDKAPTVEEAGM